MFKAIYREDLRHVLQALASAGELQGPEYKRALDDVAVAVGLETPRPATERVAWRVIEALEGAPACYVDPAG